MESITDKINELLQDPETMAQIQSLATMFGNGNQPEQPSVPPASPPSVAPPLGDSMNPELMSMVMKLAPVLSGMRKETPGTHFLQALRPLLSDPRQKKLDSAVKMMQLMSILPTLRQSGLLNQLL